MGEGNPSVRRGKYSLLLIHQTLYSGLFPNVNNIKKALTKMWLFDMR